MNHPIIILMVSLMISTGSAMAGTLPPEPVPPVYSLGRLCSLALETAETIKASENDLSIAREDRKRALSVLMPTATAYGSLTRYREPDSEKPDVTSHGITLTQSFTLNGKELIALKITEDTIDQSGYELKSVINDYLYEISSAFYQILSQERNVEIADSDVQRLKKHLSAVNERLRVGDVTKTDLYRTEAELSRAKTTLVKSKNSLHLARASLKNLVPVESNFQLAETSLNRYQDFTSTLDQLQADALKNRPEVLAAGKALNIAQKNLKYEKSAYWPTISLEGGYSDARAEYDKPIHGTADTYDTSIEAVLTFTLFDGGLRDAEIRQSLSQENSAGLQLSSVKKAVLLEAEEAWLEHETAKSVLATLGDELRSAQENFDAVTMQFQYGVADSIDMMDANTLLVTAQRQLSDAEFNLSLSILNMLRVKGDIETVLTK